MTDPNATTVLRAVLTHTVTMANEMVSTASPWPNYLKQLDARILELDEELAHRESVPTELTDTYREEIDAVTLENTLLAEKLKTTEAALTRAKRAYKEESLHANALEERLGDLEHRLVRVLRKET